MAEATNQTEYLSTTWTRVFGLYLVALAIGLGVALIRLIGSLPDPPQNQSELELILLVIIVGALGSYVHAATSFASYVGNRRLSKSWLWWYILRPFIGAALALLFYFVVRAGFLQADSGTDDLNLFGICALAGLTGMFSKQAADKLRELFDNLFRVKDERLDKLTKKDDTSGTTNADANADADTDPSADSR